MALAEFYLVLMTVGPAVAPATTPQVGYTAVRGPLSKAACEQTRAKINGAKPQMGTTTLASPCFKDAKAAKAAAAAKKRR